jgi:carnitine O-acetyltransferase
MAGTDKDIPVGVLTSENRDNWAKTRELLLEDRFNRESLDIIEKAAFVVCLDDSSPVTRHDFSRHLWHGDGRNRFFDKSIQFIVFDNGRAGFLGEHSMMDATPTSRMCEFILESIDKNAFDLAANDSLPDGLTPSKLIFELKPPVLEAISKAEKAFDDLIKTQDLKSVYCPQYGKNLIKKFGVSPDAYAQMVIQLAYYKLYGKSSATYESAQTKKYHWGRTETCRSVSNESVSWVKAMEDPHVSVRF